MFKSILSNIMPFSEQATDDNMGHVDCVLDTKGYKHTLRIILFAVAQQQQLHECT
jgi:hypothetical protein